MRPWMLACDWIIVSDCRRLDAGVQLDWTRQILTPSSRILLSDKSSASNAGVWTSQIFVCVKICAADCRRLVGVRSMNRALPNLLSLVSIMLSLMFATHALALIYSFPIFSILSIPVIHLNILIYVLSSKFYSAFVCAHATLPYITTDLTMVLSFYTNRVCCVHVLFSPFWNIIILTLFLNLINTVFYFICLNIKCNFH